MGRNKGGTPWNKKYPDNSRIEYQAWYDMHRRCYDKKSRNYRRYGARGITVCKRWEKFSNFFTDMGKRPPNTSLDRKNNNGNYSKKNCRWATKAEQCRNTSTNIWVTLRGKTQIIIDWSRELNIDDGTLYHRHKKGIPLDSS